MAAEEIYFTGEAGREIVVNWTDAAGAAYDLTGATVLRVRLKSPRTKTTYLRNATTNATPGQMRYKIVDTDWNESGPWIIQGQVTKGTDNRFTRPIVRTVEAPI